MRRFRTVLSDYRCRNGFPFGPGVKSEDRDREHQDTERHRPWILGDEREWRILPGRPDDHGEDDAGDALADDQTGREEHAHPFREFGIRGAPVSYTHLTLP